MRRDAARMLEVGVTWVHIGEFAWSRIEPTPETFDFAWLDRAIKILSTAGLKIVVGTPSCTPVRWVIDRFADILAVDDAGDPGKFGSRRYYCFSH